MFDDIIDSIGNTIDDLFTSGNNALGSLFSDNGLSSIGRAATGALKGKSAPNNINEGERIFRDLNLDVNRLPTETDFRANKTKPAESADPFAIEAAWTARLAKYAGIAQQTGVKIG